MNETPARIKRDRIQMGDLLLLKSRQQLDFAPFPSETHHAFPRTPSRTSVNRNYFTDGRISMVGMRHAEPTEKKRPNVLLIAVDDLNTHIAAYGVAGQNA